VNLRGNGFLNKCKCTLAVLNEVYIFCFGTEYCIETMSLVAFEIRKMNFYFTTRCVWGALLLTLGSFLNCCVSWCFHSGIISYPIVVAEMTSFQPRLHTYSFMQYTLPYLQHKSCHITLPME